MADSRMDVGEANSSIGRARVAGSASSRMPVHGRPLSGNLGLGSKSLLVADGGRAIEGVISRVTGISAFATLVVHSAKAWSGIAGIGDYSDH